MSIKDYIINNFKEESETNIEKAINCSIKSQEEEALPGMGVFFEILWQNSTQENKKSILNTLIRNLN